MKSLSHPHIIKLYSFEVDLVKCCLRYEYLEKGSLMEQLKKPNTFKEPVIFFFFVQCCLAVEYLHKNNIIHGDLKVRQQNK